MNIKKLLTISLLALTANMYSIYTPINGPIELSDKNRTPGAVTSQLIYNSDQIVQSKSILDLMNDFAKKRIAKDYNYDHQKNQYWISYQDMINTIKHQPSNPAAIEALKGYAAIIMYLYEQKAYIMKASSLPHYLSIARGIRSPMNLTDKRGKELDQLLNEYEQLAKTAKDMGADALGSHMQAVVFAYKNWKKWYMIAGAAAAITYICYDISQRDQKDTIVYGFLHMNIKPFIKNLIMDLKIKKNDSFTASPDIPKSPEDSVIDLMLKSKAAKDQLLEKEILSAAFQRKAFEAQQIAIAAKKEIEGLTQKLNSQEATAQNLFSRFYQQEVPCIKNVQIDNSSGTSGLNEVSLFNNNIAEIQKKDLNNAHSAFNHFDLSSSSDDAQANSDSICEKIKSIPMSLSNYIKALPAYLKESGHDYFKTFVNTYIDPASPSAIL